MSFVQTYQPSTAGILTRRLASPWLLSAVVAAAAILVLFPVPVILGTSPFWDNPRGIVGGSIADMAQAQSGYYAYVRDVWHWPLFQASGLGPNGVNIIFTDSVPIVALLGKLLFRATGQVVPLYGLWSALCVGSMALASTGLVRALGARSGAAAMSAAVIGVAMPAFLARWGHLSLMAQALIPLSLMVYVQMSKTAQVGTGCVFGRCLALCLGAVLIHPYLFLMVVGIVVAAVLQAGTDRRLPWLHAAGVLSAVAAITGCMMVVMGYGGSTVAASDAGFGVYSANLLSLLVPYSGILPDGTPYVVDGTGGQYEGMAFVGAGVMILAILARGRIFPTLAGAWQRHPWLLAVVAGFMAVAVSNEVYVGNLHVLSMPLPSALSWAAGMVRSSGRFVWVPMYLLSALAVVAASRRRDAMLILVIAAAAQMAHAEPLIDTIRSKVAGQPSSVLDMATWRSVLPGADQLVVDPPFDCLPNRQWNARNMAAVELQLLAARAGVPTNTLYAARTVRNCSVPATTPRSIIVHLDDAPPPAGLNCVTRPVGTVCSGTIDSSRLNPLLPDHMVALRP